MELVEIYVKRYKEYLIELELQEMNRKILVDKMKFMVANKNKALAIEYNIELEIIDSLITRLRNYKQEYEKLLLSFGLAFGEDEAIIFSQCIINNKKPKYIKEKYGLNEDYVETKIRYLKNMFEKIV